MANSSLELIFQGKKQNRKPAQIINLDLDDSRQTLAAGSTQPPSAWVPKDRLHKKK
jgi:hypothetical protein